MVLELKVPHGADLAALASLTPVFLSYVLSFVYVAIYWNNHHHFFHLVRDVDGLMLWANLHLLFWLSLIPFATASMGENNFATVPTALYGIALLMPALACRVCSLRSSEITAATRHSRRRLAATSKKDVTGCPARLCRSARGGCDVSSGDTDVAGPRPAHRKEDLGRLSHSFLLRVTVQASERWPRRA